MPWPWHSATAARAQALQQHAVDETLGRLHGQPVAKRQHHRLLDPGHAEAHCNLGTALANLEQFSAAASAFGGGHCVEPRLS